MRLTSEIKVVNGEESYWDGYVLEIEPNEGVGEAQMSLHSDKEYLFFGEFFAPGDDIDEWDEDRTIYRVGDKWCFVRYNGSENYTLTIQDGRGVHDVCEFRPDTMKLIVEWTPRLAKSAELYKVGADRLVRREERVEKINKYLPRQLKIKSLLTK